MTTLVPPDLDSSTPALARCLELCRLYAGVNRPIVLLGPVGSGKTTLAQLIHRLSNRPGAFVAVSSGELLGTLYEDTLFGHVKGGYTGATAARDGALMRASKGTLLLDDVALMSVEAQAALLRVLEDRRFTPLGASEDVPATGREIFASTVDPADLVSEGRLLPDLESRLGELIIAVPGLRDRPADIPILVDRIARDFALEHGWDSEVQISPLIYDVLLRHTWPKNVRELRWIMEHAILHARSAASTSVIRVLPQHLPARLHSGGRGGGSAAAPLSKKLTRAAVEAAVRQAGGNQSEAARILQVHRNTIRAWLKSA